MCSILSIRLQDLREFSLRNENLTLGNHRDIAPLETQVKGYTVPYERAGNIQSHQKWLGRYQTESVSNSAVMWSGTLVDDRIRQKIA